MLLEGTGQRLRTKDWTSWQSRQCSEKARGPEGRGWLRTPTTSLGPRTLGGWTPQTPNTQQGRPAGPRSGTWLGDRGPQFMG